MPRQEWKTDGHPLDDGTDRPSSRRERTDDEPVLAESNVHSPGGARTSDGHGVAVEMDRTETAFRVAEAVDPDDLEPVAPPEVRPTENRAFGTAFREAVRRE